MFIRVNIYEVICVKILRKDLYITLCLHAPLYDFQLFMFPLNLVKTWGGEDSSLSRSLHGNEASKEQAQDEWDMEYDAGKVKKTKKHQEETTSSFKRNPFQAAHDNNKYNKVRTVI